MRRDSSLIIALTVTYVLLMAKQLSLEYCKEMQEANCKEQEARARPVIFGVERYWDLHFVSFENEGRYLLYYAENDPNEG